MSDRVINEGSSVQEIESSFDVSGLKTPSHLLERQPLTWEQPNEVVLSTEDNNPRLKNFDKQLAEKNKALV